MKVLIVYDTVFGNTEKLAKAIGEALAPNAEAATIRVGEVNAEQLKGLDILFVGSPTRAFRPTKAITTFLNSIPKDGLKGIGVAAFDTRSGQEEMKSGWLRGLAGMFGYAAKPISDKLERKGGKILAQPEGFYVLGSEGPLKDGELERAAAWAKTLPKKREGSFSLQ